MSDFFTNERVKLSKRGEKTFAHLAGLIGIVLEERRSPLWGHNVIVQFTIDGHWERLYAKSDELLSAEIRKQQS
jgi:hypothetical protein